MIKERKGNREGESEETKKRNGKKEKKEKQKRAKERKRKKKRKKVKRKEKKEKIIHRKQGISFIFEERHEPPYPSAMGYIATYCFFYKDRFGIK